MELFQRFLNQVNQKYKEADKATGGWLPGGGTASPLTRYKQEGEQRMAEQMRRQAEQYVGQPGRLAGKGQLVNAILATAQAGTDPVSVALGDKKAIGKVSNYYSQYPGMQNEFDLNTNMFLRYISGTGAEGLKIAPEVGKQLYSDIQQQEQKFRDPQYREMQISPFSQNPRYIKENLLKGRIPVYYGGVADTAISNVHQSQLPINKGERWQLQNSLGAHWADPSENGYTIKGEKYNFVYAPVEKGGDEKFQNSFFLPINPANIGRNIVKQGFGKPFEYSLNVDQSGAVQSYP
jgi:hypothetical protein